MANRSFLPPLGALEVDVVDLFGNITIGSSGAVSAFSGKGISNVVLTSTGKYTITLSDSYNLFLTAQATNLDSSATVDPTTNGVAMRWLSQAVSSSPATVVLQCYSVTDGSAANPHSGSTIYFALKLRNSSVS